MSAVSQPSSGWSWRREKIAFLSSGEARSGQNTSTWRRKEGKMMKRAGVEVILQSAREW